MEQTRPTQVFIWNEFDWFTDRLHRHSLWLGIKLFLQLSDLGFQGGNGGLVLGLDGSFKLLQFQLQLLVLAIQLGASPLQLLGVAALSSQLCGQLLSLVRDTQDTAHVKVKCAAGRLCTFSSSVVLHNVFFSYCSLRTFLQLFSLSVESFNISVVLCIHTCSVVLLRRSLTISVLRCSSSRSSSSCVIRASSLLFSSVSRELATASEDQEEWWLIRLLQL